MKLRKKLLFLYLIVGMLVLLVMGVWMFTVFRRNQMQIIQTNVNNQLMLLDFSLTSFFDEVEQDVQTLAENDLVRSRNDENFTNFLTADETTFKYDITEPELSIIKILNTYRTTHPYVNSVYMGRENGSFVRSHPRNQPTEYDPRDRPWYILAKENPGEVVLTDPYQSVTSADVNIGIVTSLLDQTGEVYGVIGVDVTLANLTNFISSLDVGYAGQLMLIDNDGTILASEDKENLFINIQTLFGGQSDEIMGIGQGVKNIKDNYYFVYTSQKLSWKITAVIPVSIINREVQRFAFYPPLIGLFLTIILLGLLLNIGLNKFVLNPLIELRNFTDVLSRPGSLNQHVEIRSGDEFGELGESFNQMIDVRMKVEETLQQERDLARALADSIAVFVTSLDLEQILDHILEQISSVVPNDAVNIMLIQGGGEARISRSRGYEKYGLEKAILKAAFKLSEISSLQQMLEKREPILIPDTREFAGRVVLEGQEFLRSYAAAPIIVRNEIIGFLNVDSGTANYFSSAHLDALKIFSGYAAIAIENAQLHEQIKRHASDLEAHIAIATEEINRRADELRALYGTGKKITSTLELKTMLQIVSNEAKKITNADKSVIMLVDVKNEQLLHVVGSGFSRVELESQTFQEFQDGISGWVLLEKTPTLSEDIRKDDRNRGKALARAVRGTKKSVAVAPLIIAGVVIGTLTVIKNNHKRIFNPDDLNLVTMLANQAAIAIHNADLYKSAQEADRIKSAFLASMSHELRTPLNSIIGFTGILLQGIAGNLNDEQKKQLRMVQNSASHLLDLINDILDISKIEADQLEISAAPFDLRIVIEKVVQAVAPLAAQKNLPLHVSVHPEIGQITSDQRRVEQILINLVNNAIKFTEKGELRIECQVNGGLVETRVVDTGIGISEEDQKKLFKPFQQLDIGLSRHYEGTGLGLSICKRLVEKLGGTIWVESEIGIGSTFTFTLPLKIQETENEK